MSDSSSRGATTAVVGIVALLAIVLLVYVAFLRGGDTGGGTDIDVTIDPGDAIESVTE